MSETTNQYRKKSVVVEAEQFTESHTPKGVVREEYFTDPADLGGRRLVKWYYVLTIHGQKTGVVHGDWIIAEPDGEHFYPCKPDIFEATYEAVVAPAAPEAKRGLNLAALEAEFDKAIESETPESLTKWLNEKRAATPPAETISQHEPPRLHSQAPRMNIPLLQTDLKLVGLYTGAIDGIWGPKTEAAWIAWTTVKANRIEGSTFPYDTYRTVTVALNQTMRTEYLPAMERALVGFTKGMKLLCTVMAHAQGFYPKSTAYKTNNPGNVGNTDTGAHKTFATLEGGIAGQAGYIARVAVGRHPAYPLGKDKVLKAWFSPEIARNRKTYGVPTGQLPGYRFIYTGEISQYVKIYATLPRLGNSYVNQIVSYFAQHGYSIAPESKLAEIIELC